MSRHGLRDRLVLGARRFAAARREGGLAQRLAQRNGNVAVLMYHRVLPDDLDASGIEPGMFVRASTFERQLAWLGETTTVVPLDSLLDDPPAADDPPRVAITFDDGWRDNMSVAWPLLRAAGLPATVFLVRDWVAGGDRRGEFLDPAAVAELAAAGLDFGAHTVTHPRLTGLAPASLAAELELSRDAVQRWTGRRCRSFAYPFGDHDDRVVEAASAVFDAAVIVGGGWWRPGLPARRIPRIGIHEDMTSTRGMFLQRMVAA